MSEEYYANVDGENVINNAVKYFGKVPNNIVGTNILLNDVTKK